MSSSFLQFLKSAWNYVQAKFEGKGQSLTPYIFLAIFSNFFLLPNISLASQSHDNVPNKELLDSREQKEIDSIKEMKSPRVLLAIPYREYLVSPTEEDFRRDACKYDIRGKSIEIDLMNAINKSHLLAYKKSVGWTNAIIGIDYSDSKGGSHTLLFDQDYPGHDRINGYFDGHPITADSSFVQSIYRIILDRRTNNPCDPFISSYLK